MGGGPGVPGSTKEGPSSKLQCLFYWPLHIPLPEQGFCLTAGGKGMSLRNENRLLTVEEQEAGMGEGKAMEGFRPQH